MDNSLLSLYPSQEERPPNERPFAALPSREQVIAHLATDEVFDLVIVGGGITGAATARDAALQGLRVLVVEPEFFGSRSSSWRSYVAYALGAKPQRIVLDAHHLRSVASRVAPHLADVRRYHGVGKVGPLKAVAAWLVRSVWMRAHSEFKKGWIPDLDERLLVREVVLAARQEGALVLSGFEIGFVERQTDEENLLVSIRDVRELSSYEIKTKAIFVDQSYARPLTSRLGRVIVQGGLGEFPIVSIVYKIQGAQNLEECCPEGLSAVELSGGSLALVQPLSSAHVEVTVHIAQTSPSDTEISSALLEVRRTFGFNTCDEISRHRGGQPLRARARLVNDKGTVTLKPAAPWRAFANARKLVMGLCPSGELTGMSGRRALPGEESRGEIRAFRDAARTAGVAEATVDCVVSRWLGRVRYLETFDRAFEEVCPGVLRGEIELAVASDQVNSLEDLIFGSLSIQSQPEWQKRVPRIAEVLRECSGLPETAIDIHRAVAFMS